MRSREEPIADADDGMPTVPLVRPPVVAADRTAPQAPAEPHRVALAHTAERLLDGDETARLLAFCRYMASITGIGILVLPFLYNPARPLYFPVAAAIVALCGSSSFLWWRVSRGHRLSRYANRVYTVLCFLPGFLIIYDLGLFSPAPLFGALGLTTVVRSHDRRFSVGTAVVCSLTYLALALLVVFGVIPDVGLISPKTASIPARLVFVVLVPFSYSVGAWQGWQSRRATLAAIEKEHEALRNGLTRDAQLAEANQNLDAALRAGAGAKGRYSGARMGRFRLAEIVGRGAMGEIYAAADVDTGAPAAVKVLQAAASSDPDLVERFLREGRIAAHLRAPNVVTVLDVGTADDVPFIAMELLVGEDLASHLRRSPRLGLSATIELCAQLAGGLDAAHRAGVIHRDLKPQNVFRAEQPGGGPAIWKILDFGVSKLRESTGTLTNAGPIGTPGYMSPEQASGKDTDHRSDVFSLGAVAYRTLTGRPPFAGGVPQVLFDIVSKSPIRPSALLPALPPDVDRVLAIALAKHAKDRFDGALELAAALRDAARGALSPSLRARADALVAAAPWRSPLPAA